MDEKPFKTIDEMSSLLVQRRGLVCSSIDELKNFLERVNYYRFSGYAREFQHAPKYGDNNFMDGVSFQQIVNLMEMDSKLRHLLLEQLGIIEIAIRAKIAYEYGHDYGNTAYYLDIDNYNEGNNPSVDRPFSIVQGILSDLERDKSRMLGRYADSSIISNDFDSKCKRYRNVPIWVAVEVLSFGRISNMITYIKDINPAKRVAASLGVQWGPFADVIHSFSVMRNLCAHHRQLWNRRMDIKCPVQKKLRPRNIHFTSTSPYAHIIMTNYYRSKIDGDTSVANQINDLLKRNYEFAEGIYRPNPK